MSLSKRRFQKRSSRREENQSHQKGRHDANELFRQTALFRAPENFESNCYPATYKTVHWQALTAAVVKRDPVIGLLVGHVPGFPGAHSQAESLDELNANLREVISMLLEDEDLRLEAGFCALS